MQAVAGSLLVFCCRILVISRKCNITNSINKGIIHPVTNLEARGLDYKTQAMRTGSRIQIGTHSSGGDLKRP